MTPETKVKNDVIKYLDNLQKEGVPFFYERRQALSCSGYKVGSADLFIVTKGGIHIEIEFKRSDGKGVNSSLQLKWKTRMEKLGVPYYLCDNLEGLKEFLKPYLGKK